MMRKPTKRWQLEGDMEHGKRKEQAKGLAKGDGGSSSGWNKNGWCWMGWMGGGHVKGQ